MTHQHAVVICSLICEGAHINNQQSHFGTSVVTLQIRNTSIIETVGVLLTNYVPPHVPFFYWLGGAMWGSYLSTWGVRSNPCACSSGGEPFWLLPAEHLPPNVSINGARAPVSLCGYVSLEWDLRERKRKSEKNVLHGSWCKIRRTYIALTATYSKHDEYKDDDIE